MIANIYWALTCLLLLLAPIWFSTFNPYGYPWLLIILSILHFTELSKLYFQRGVLYFSFAFLIGLTASQLARQPWRVSRASDIWLGLNTTLLGYLLVIRAKAEDHKVVCVRMWMKLLVGKTSVVEPVHLDLNSYYTTYC